jgi:hypothetical protein
MAEELIFRGWARSAAAAGAVSEQNGRLQGSITLTMTSTVVEPSQDEKINFEFYGPADVGQLQPGAIRRRYPLPGATNVEPAYCAYVEFSAADLPWRYSLLRDTPDALKPWLVLVVGSSEEISLLPGGQALLSKSVMSAHDLSQSARWAHLQRDPSGNEVTRLLSPQDLSRESATTWLAVLVPTYQDNGTLRWQAGATDPVQVPVYGRWTFYTREKIGFVELARNLEPESPQRGMGYAPLAYQLPDEELTPQLVAAGALIDRIPPPDNDPRRTPLPPPIALHFQDLLVGGELPRDAAGRPVDDDGRPVVKLPVYGEPWMNPDDPQPRWAVELNADPRLRGAAGLGAWAAIEWQETIVEAAAKQAGAQGIAAQKIRGLTLGLEATRRLWDRRFLPAPRDERLLIIGPAMSRMPAAGGGTVLNRVAAAGRPLPSALFSSAARRTLRPRGPMGRRAAEGAMKPGRWLPLMNNCEEFAAPRLALEGLPHAEFAGISELEIRVGEFREAFGDDNELYAEHFRLTNEALDFLVENEQEENAGLEASGAPRFDIPVQDLGESLGDGDAAVRLFVEVFIEQPDRSCVLRDVKLDVLDRRLLEEMDPHAERPFVVERVLSTIQGLDDQPLTPPELCLDFEIPAWKFLRDNAKDWLLPGIDRMVVYKRQNGQILLDDEGRRVVDPEKDPVVAVSTNDLFTDAFMVGFNQQALQELRWRNIAVQTGCTPLRRFWEPAGVRPTTPPHPNAGKLDTLEDINGIHMWGNTPLGDDSHETAVVRGDNLVLVFKTALFRRYPDTLVYLVPRRADDPDWQREPDWSGTRLEPNIQAIVDRETVLFGFSREREVLKDHWLVLEQIPKGFNFYNKASSVPPERQADYVAAKDGGTFAKTAFANPVRLIIKGPLMMAEEV